MTIISMRAIATVHSTRTAMRDDGWDREQVYIELDPDTLPDEALLGLDTFSHVEVVFYMDRVKPESVETSARHPRNNRAWPKVGILAQRGKDRLNQIGVTVCRVLRVEGRKLFVEGLDAVNGSPVLDLKPWVREFGPRGTVTQPEWMTELMRAYWAPAGDAKG